MLEAVTIATSYARGVQHLRPTGNLTTLCGYQQRALTVGAYDLTAPKCARCDRALASIRARLRARGLR